jgi:hypothetical protein
MSRAFLAASLVAILPCVRADADGEAVPPPPPPLRFAWPVPGRVRVVETQTKPGHVSRLGYVLVTEPLGENEIRVRFEDRRLLEYDGIAASDPVLAAYAPLLDATTGTMADLVVSRDGRLLRVEGLDRVI